MAQRHEAPTTARQIADQLAAWRRQLVDHQAKLQVAAGIAAALQLEHDALLVAARIDKDTAAETRLVNLTGRQLLAQQKTLDAEVILAQIQRHIDELERNLLAARGAATAATGVARARSGRERLIQSA